MGLQKLGDKLADYKARLDSGKASKIKLNHVEKILSKLRKKVVALEAEIASERRDDKKARLERKLGVAQTQIERAEWLLKELAPA